MLVVSQLHGSERAAAVREQAPVLRDVYLRVVADVRREQPALPRVSLRAEDVRSQHRRATQTVGQGHPVPGGQVRVQGQCELKVSLCSRSEFVQGQCAFEVSMSSRSSTA